MAFINFLNVALMVDKTIGKKVLKRGHNVAYFRLTRYNKSSPKPFWDAAYDRYFSGVLFCAEHIKFDLFMLFFSSSTYLDSL